MEIGPVQKLSSMAMVPQPWKSERGSSPLSPPLKLQGISLSLSLLTLSWEWIGVAVSVRVVTVGQ